MNHILTIIGIILSTVYSVIVYQIVGDRLQSLQNMPLNEVGDFLAGVFGPLAILWLVLGFLQQGKELRQNTEALELQAEELSNSVHQQEELVEISWRQHEVNVEALDAEKIRIKKLSEPNFSLLGFGGVRSRNYKLSCIFINTGATAIHFNASIDTNCIVNPKTQFSIWEKQETKRIEFLLSLDMLPNTINIKISYSNELSEHFEQKFTANKKLENNNVVYSV